MTERINERLGEQTGGHIKRRRPRKASTSGVGGDADDADDVGVGREGNEKMLGPPAPTGRGARRFLI